MAYEAILAGSAAALAAAAHDVLAGSGLRLGATVLVGRSKAAALASAQRVRSWDDFDPAAFNADAIVLAEALPAKSLRVLLERAAGVCMRIYRLERGAVRPLALADLYAEQVAELNWSRIRAAIEGKRVLITGGGGSIGGELARIVATLGPERLTLLDASECNLFKVSLDVPGATLALADIRDGAVVRRWFMRERPQIVFHAAALKQVPLVEAFPSEAMMTNILGLRHVAEAAHGVGADLVFVSTDKAVAPSSVMGASKRLGELYCQALDRRGHHRAVPVRLGNVLGSAGSVAPTFEAQLAAGKALTVTDAHVSRYFMSIPQAAGALLQAAALGLDGAAHGAALVIDMGQPRLVVDLAYDIIRLSGRRPEVDAPIVFTGLRPGEKLHEDLIGVDEHTEAAPAKGVTAVSSAPRGLGELHETMDQLVRLAREGANDPIREAVFSAIVEAPAEDAAAVAV